MSYLFKQSKQLLAVWSGIATALMFISMPAMAQNAKALQEIVHFEDDVERQRYFRLVKEYRCPKCQNQNLLDSNSQISIDLRNTVARLIREGRTDKEIDRYMVDRYGDFVLYKPQIKNSTWLLYYGPFIFLFLGAIAYIFVLRVRAKATASADRHSTKATLTR